MNSGCRCTNIDEDEGGRERERERERERRKHGNVVLKMKTDVNIELVQHINDDHLAHERLTCLDIRLESIYSSIHRRCHRRSRSAHWP